MLFNTPVFAIFFLIFFVVFWFLPQGRGRLWLILISSFLFYAWGYPAHVWLLAYIIVVSFFFARRMGDVDDRRAKGRLLFTGVIVCIVPLVLYKYTNFLLENVEGMMSLGGVSVELGRLELGLPAGISFFTFQAIGYMVDVYRGSFRADTSLLTYGSSLAFFPQLVAGPIVRAAHLVPQLDRPVTLEWNAAKYSMLLVGVGLAKKTGADLLAPVSQAFLEGGGAGVAESWIGALAFVAQMYGDFSGYTDMAIGLGGLAGYEIPANFHLPYFATSPIDFWKRWHISLTSWMRDYVFFSLDPSRVYRNLFITWLVTGIWHGARWNFVYWGLLHGIVLAGNHLVNARVRKARASGRESFLMRLGWGVATGQRKPVWGVAGWVFTMWLWTTSLVVFGAPSGAAAVDLVTGMYVGGGEATAGGASIVTAILVAAALLIPHALDYLVIAHRQIALRPYVLWPLLVVAFVFALMYASGEVHFIYFEF